MSEVGTSDGVSFVKSCCSGKNIGSVVIINGVFFSH